MAPANDCGTQCPVHGEFARRLDNRWDDHIEGHVRDKSDMCRKFDLLFDLTRKLDSKINWILGGTAASVFVIQLLLNLLWKGH